MLFTMYVQVIVNMEESGQVSVDLLLDFLQLCESSGFIELKLPLEDLKSKLNLLWGAIFQGQSGSTSPQPCTSHPEEEACLDTSHTCVTNSFSLLSSKSPLPSPGLSESHTFGNHGEGVSESFLFDVPTPELTPNTGLVSQCMEEEREAAALTPNIPVATPHLEGDRRVCDEKSTSPLDPVAGSKPRQHKYDCGEVSFLSPKEVCSNDDSPVKELRVKEISPGHASDYSELCLKVEPFDLSGCDMADEDSCHTVEEEVTGVNGDPTEDNVTSTMEPLTTCSNPIGSVSQPIVVDSDDEEADEKLENLFAQLKIESSKKNAPKHISSRKSLAAFIASDSEEVESDSDDEGHNENHTPWKVPLTMPSYSTSDTPYTRVAFCRSPDMEDSVTTKPTTQLHPPKPICTPLGERNHTYYSTPVAGFRRYISKPVTTPSANKNFSRYKTQMIQELFELFNSTVFENKLPADLEIKWNNKLRTTAGYCYNLGFGLSRRHARIELSTKVCDSYERIRATLIHEMCHAATWIIDGIKGGGHGAQWKAWARKVSMIHPDLEPVTRCHGYEIAYKHMYKCTRCDHHYGFLHGCKMSGSGLGTRFGRHSKSVNLQTDRCPCCLGLSHTSAYTLQVIMAAGSLDPRPFLTRSEGSGVLTKLMVTLELLPRLKADGTPVMKKLNRYAQFVKENYAAMKLQTPGGSHKDVMERLKTAYHEKDNATIADTRRSFSA